jgi:hypothetical protein
MEFEFKYIDGFSTLKGWATCPDIPGSLSSRSPSRPDLYNIIQQPAPHKTPLFSISTISIPRPLLLRLLFIRRLSPQLQRMNTPIPLHLLLDQLVHHPMSRRLHLALECFRRDHDAEMGFLGGGARHGLVVGVEVGVVVDF